MFGFQIFLALVIFSNFQVAFFLDPLPDFEDNDLLRAEEIIRSTTNTLFSSLGTVKSRNQRFKKYAIVHHYFASLTQQDNDNLKEIAKLTRVNKTNINNVTAVLIAAINAVVEQESHLNLKELPSLEINDNDKDAKKKELINAFYDDQVNISEEVLNILESENTQNRSSVLYNRSSFENDEKYVWRGDILNIGRRLYDAKPTKIKHFKFMASVQIFNKFQCAGNIIKTDLILTAASCLQLAHNNRFFRENPPFLSVRVGSTYVEFGGEVINVMEIYFHPSYVPKTLRNNLAIMRLHRHISFKKKSLKRIKIDKHRKINGKTGRITIVGWGAKTESGHFLNPLDRRLRYAKLNLYDLEDCQDVYSKQLVTREVFCAGFISHGGGACNNDVGGPGIAHGKLIGIVSFGSPVCGAQDAPTVFVKLGYYTDWIEEIMEKEVPHIRERTTLKPYKHTYGPPNYEMPKKRRVTPITSTKSTMSIITAPEFTETERPNRQTIYQGFTKEATTVITDNKTNLKNMLRNILGDGINEFLGTYQDDNFKAVSSIPLGMLMTPKFDNDRLNNKMNQAVKHTEIRLPSSEQQFGFPKYANNKVQNLRPRVTPVLPDRDSSDVEYSRSMSGEEYPINRANMYGFIKNNPALPMGMPTETKAPDILLSNQYVNPVTKLTKSISDLIKKEMHHIFTQLLNETQSIVVKSTNEISSVKGQTNQSAAGSVIKKKKLHSKIKKKQEVRNTQSAADSVIKKKKLYSKIKKKQKKVESLELNYLSDFPSSREVQEGAVRVFYDDNLSTFHEKKLKLRKPTTKTKLLVHKNKSKILNKSTSSSSEFETESDWSAENFNNTTNTGEEIGYEIPVTRMRSDISHKAYYDSLNGKKIKLLELSKYQNKSKILIKSSSSSSEFETETDWSPQNFYNMTNTGEEIGYEIPVTRMYSEISYKPHHDSFDGNKIKLLELSKYLSKDDIAELVKDIKARKMLEKD